MNQYIRKEEYKGIAIQLLENISETNQQIIIEEKSQPSRKPTIFEEYLLKIWKQQLYNKTINPTNLFKLQKLIIKLQIKDNKLLETIGEAIRKEGINHTYINAKRNSRERSNL